MEYVIVLIVAIVLWRVAVKKNKENKPKIERYTMSSNDTTNTDIKFNDFSKKNVEKVEVDKDDRKINFSEIKYKLSPSSRKNKLIINVIREKSIKAKVLRTGTYCYFSTCIIDDSNERVLGFRAIQNKSNEWIFEKAFDVKSKNGKFNIDELDYSSYALLDFNKEPETIKFKYFKRGSDTYLIDNINLI